MAPADMPFGRVVSATSPGGTRLPSPRGASLPRRTERVWVEGGRSQMATIWTDEAGTGIQALNSGRAGMDYVQNLSRMRPDSSPMRNLTPDAAQREVEAVWRSSTFGKVRGGPQQYLTDETNDWRVRPAGYIPRTNTPFSSSASPAAVRAMFCTVRVFPRFVTRWLSAARTRSSRVNFVFARRVWRIVEMLYLHSPSPDTKAKEAPLSMLVPMWILAAATVYFGTHAALTSAAASRAASTLISTSNIIWQ